MTPEAGAPPKGVEQVIRLRDRDHAAAYKAYADDSRLWGVSVVWPTTDPVKIQAGHHTNKQPCGLDGNTAAKNSEEKGGVYLLEHDYATALAAVCKLNKAAQAAQIDKAYCLARRCDVTADGIILVDIDGEIPSPAYYGGVGIIERSASSTGLHGLFRATGELREALDALRARGKKNKVKKQIDGSDIEVFYGLGNYVALTGDILSSDGGSDLPRSCKLYTNILQICKDEGDTERQRAEGSFTSVGTEPTAAGDAGYQRYEKLISHIGELATQWRPKDGFKPEDNASDHLYALTCYICEQLKVLGFPLDRHSAGCVGVIYNIIVPQCSVWKAYYAPDATYGQHKWYVGKITTTIENAIDEVLKGSTGSGCPSIVRDVVCRAGEYIRTETEADGTKKFVFNVWEYRHVWHDATYVCHEKGAKDGYLWYNGAEWQNDPHGTTLRGYLEKAAGVLADQYAKAWAAADKAGGRERLRKMIRNSTTLDEICALRAEPTADPTAAYGKGLTLQDGVMIIDAQGIHITQHDPEREVCFGAVNAKSTDLLDDIENMTFEEVVNHFPHARDSLLACGEEKARDEKVRLMASLAIVAIYYTMPHHHALDIWPYLYDTRMGGTGKTTHIRLLESFLGGYVAKGVDRDVFVGKTPENGDWLGKVAIVCEEIGVNTIQDTEKIKARTSGNWPLKRLYSGRIPVSQPLLMISLGNTKPLLTHVANEEAVRDRLQPCEFTIKLRGMGQGFPCEPEEYYRFLLNVGVWGALQLLRKGTAAYKQDLPYYVAPEEVKELCERVPWEDVMTDIGMWQAGAETPLKDVYEAVKEELKKQGWENFTGAPELKSLESFKRAVDGMRIKLGEGRYGTPLKVVCVNAAKRSEYGKYKLTNYVLNTPPPEEHTDTEQTEPTAPELHAAKALLSKSIPTKPRVHGTQAPPTSTRWVPGKYRIESKTREFYRVSEPFEESKSWDRCKFTSQPDPLPEVEGVEVENGAAIEKPAVFVVEGNRLVEIKPPEPAA